MVDIEKIKNIKKDLNNGVEVKDVASKYAVSLSTVYRYKKFNNDDIEKIKLRNEKISTTITSSRRKWYLKNRTHLIEKSKKPKVGIKKQVAEKAERANRANELKKQGLKAKEIATLLNVDISVVYKYLRVNR